MTNISNVHGYVMSDGEKMPAEGSPACALRPVRPLGDLIRRAASLSKRWPICCSWRAADAGASQPVRGSDRFPARAARRIHGQHAYGGYLARSHEQDGSFHPAPVRGRRVRRGPLSRARDSHGASLISRLPRIMVLAYYAKQAAFNHEPHDTCNPRPDSPRPRPSFPHAAPRPLVHTAEEGPHARHHAVPARRARRRQQLVVHDPCAVPRRTLTPIPPTRRFRFAEGTVATAARTIRCAPCRRKSRRT